MDWTSLFTFAGTAGVITALLNAAFGWVRDAFKRRSRARYLALRAAIHLETFLSACASRAADIDLYLQSGAAAGASWTDMPELPDFPLTEEYWMALAPDLAERCLSLPHDLRYASAYVSAAADEAYEPDGHFDVVAAANDRLLRLGLDAGALAASLRERYRWRSLPSAQDSISWMTRELAKIEADKVQAEARRASRVPQPPTLLP